MPGERRFWRRLAAPRAALAIVACAQAPVAPEAGRAGPAGTVGSPGPLPAGAAAQAAWAAAAPRIDADAAAAAYAGARTYSGAVFCAGCPERRLTLTIFPDGTFRMLQAGQAGAGLAVLHDFGRWSVSPDAPGMIALHGDAEGARLLRRVVPDGLAIVDNEGREIRGLGDAALARAPRVDPLPGPLRLAGSYTRDGERAVFTECLTGRRLPVVSGEPASGSAQARRWLAEARSALDRAYDAMGGPAAGPVFAVVRGYLVPRIAQPGDPEREALVVVAFERAARSGRCEDVVHRTPP